MAKRLFVDMDGTLARFHDEVSYLERMYEEGFFSGLKPFEKMVAGIKLFMEQNPDIEVYTISSSIESPYCIPEKNAWLDNHLNISPNHRIFPPMGKSKADYIPGGVTKDDYLLDDYNKGLNQFLYDGGSAIKCHNNINQQGLGAYGGSPGNLWVGDMVHTDDTPELIAAELAQCMQLEHGFGAFDYELPYDLETVVEAYPDISLTNLCNPIQTSKALRPAMLHEAIISKSGKPIDQCKNSDELSVHTFFDPLHAIRFLDGKNEFDEIQVKYLTSSYHVPLFRLKAICSNLYGDMDYEKHLSQHPDTFSKDVLLAIANSNQPTVGRVDFLNRNGEIQRSQTFHFAEQMKQAIAHYQFIGQPISVNWFVTPETLPFNEITNCRHLQESLQFCYDFNVSDAEIIANALVTPYSQRTAEQNDLLKSVWRTKSLPGTLDEFIRKPDAKAKDIKSNLDSLISNANSRISSKGDDHSDKSKICR